MRFLTVTLNPCIDRTAWINGFNYGHYNKVQKTNIDISGKGINVSVAMSQLGMDTKALFYNFSNDEKVIPTFLEKKGIPYTAVDVEGNLRVNVKLFNQVTKEMTEVNEGGFPVTEADIQKAYDAIVNDMDECDAIVLTGSLPPTVPKDFYYKLILEAKKKGLYTVLDADNELLVEGLKALPDFIKPNIDELMRLVNRELNTFGEIVDAAKELVANGIKKVCVSMGGDGSILTDGEKVVFSKCAPVEVKGLQGAGDSLVTGILMAVDKSLCLEHQMKYGVAVAGGSVMLEGTQLCTKENFEMLLPKIEVSVL